MTNPAPVEPFNGKPANNLQGTDMSPAQAYKMTNLDEQINRIYVKIADAEDDWFNDRTINTRQIAIDEIKALIANQVQEAYQNGYNDNARDCYCDSPGATDGVIAHHHLLDDGKCMIYDQTSPNYKRRTNNE